MSTAGLRFQLPLQQDLVPGEVGLCTWRFFEDMFFPFEHLQPHEGASEFAAGHEQLAGFGAASETGAVFTHFTEGGYRDHETGLRAGRVAPDKVHLVPFAGQANARIQLFGGLYAEAVGQGEAHDDLCGPGIHGADVAEIDHNGFVAQVLERGVHEIEVHAFTQQIRADHGALALLGSSQYGGIVAHTNHRSRGLQFDVFGDFGDESEFSNRAYFSAFRVHWAKLLVRNCLSLKYHESILCCRSVFQFLLD